MPSKRDGWQQPDVCCAVLHPLACSTPRAAPPGWAPPPPPATGGPCPARPPRAARCAPPCPANGQTGGGCRVVTLQLASRYAMAHRQISTTTHAENWLAAQSLPPNPCHPSAHHAAVVVQPVIRGKVPQAGAPEAQRRLGQEGRQVALKNLGCPRVLQVGRGLDRKFSWRVGIANCAKVPFKVAAASTTRCAVQRPMPCAQPCARFNSPAVRTRPSPNSCHTSS